MGVGAEYHHPGRRLLAAHFFSRILPVQIQESPGLSRAEQLLKEGYGLVIAIPHPSKGDFFRVLTGLFQESEEIRERQILIPIAEHQRHAPGLYGLARLMGIGLPAIVTTDTLDKARLREQQGKKIRWQIQSPLAGLKEYARQGGEVLSSGGVVLFAPQAGRRAVLNPFEGLAFGLLGGQIERRMIRDRVAYLFGGIEIPGVKDYGKDPGYHFFERYLVAFKQALTADELSAMAADNRLTIDQMAHRIMLDLAPPSYRPLNVPPS